MFYIPNKLLRLMKEMVILRNFPMMFIKFFIYTAMVKVVCNEHLHIPLLDFTTNIVLYFLYHKSICLYLTLFILILDAFLSNLQTSVYFILNTSTCVSFKRKLLSLRSKLWKRQSLLSHNNRLVRDGETIVLHLPLYINVM